MAMEPAAISAKPATTMMRVAATAPERPAARANGTVSPSAMPITTSRTNSEAVKCDSMCWAWGIAPSLCQPGAQAFEIAEKVQKHRLKSGALVETGVE